MENLYVCPVCGIGYMEHEYENYLDHVHEHESHPYEEASNR